MKIARRVLAFAFAAALSGCGDSTMLTGPEAEAAFVEAQQRVEDGEQVRIRGTTSIDDAPPPVIFVDGARLEVHPTSVLRQIRPEDIDRIEVKKGCHAWGYLGDADWNSGIILIYTDDHDGTEPDLTFDEARAEACVDEYRRTGRFPWQER